MGEEGPTFQLAGKAGPERRPSRQSLPGHAKRAYRPADPRITPNPTSRRQPFVSIRVNLWLIHLAFDLNFSTEKATGSPCHTHTPPPRGWRGSGSPESPSPCLGGNRIPGRSEETICRVRRFTQIGLYRHGGTQGRTSSSFVALGLGVRTRGRCARHTLQSPEDGRVRGTHPTPGHGGSGYMGPRTAVCPYTLAWPPLALVQCA